MKKTFIIAAVLLALALPARSLDLGDKAPEIRADTWVTGEPADPTKIDDKTIYLVEVWSTDCPPCVTTIPILNDLQKRYAKDGFKIISFTSDAIGDVEPFLKDHPIEYSMFIDSDGTSTINYMVADNRNTIPHAFLFDRTGALVWTGNPLDNLERRLKQVIDGSLNRDKAVAIREGMLGLQAAFESQNFEGMLKSLKQLEELEPDNAQYFQIHYRILTELGLGEDAEVRDLLTSWYKGSQDQPEALAVLSMVALEQGPPQLRNPELALAAAKRAYAIDSPAKMEAGLNLAEVYKSVGRPDLALAVIKEIAATAPPERIDTLIAVENFYRRIIDLGKNPDAPFNP